MRYKANNAIYALKVLNRHFLRKNNAEQSVISERNLLMKLKHPNIIKLSASFQNEDFICL